MAGRTIIDKRRRKLGLPIRALVKLSGVPVATVNRILANPGPVHFQSVAAVGLVLGIDFANAKRVSVEEVFQNRVRHKAHYVARLVQGTQGLEAAGVDESGFQKLVAAATQSLLAGKKKKLWDEE